jgi:hypothetical protein
MESPDAYASRLSETGSEKVSPPISGDALTDTQ